MNQLQDAVPSETPLAYWCYEASFWISGPLMTLACSLRTEGAQHVPTTGPALLIANHQSFIDPLLIGLAARRHLSYLARQSLFHNRAFGWFIRQYNAVPINQDGFSREGLRTIIDYLKAGRAVVMFPEGERTPHGDMQPLRPGVHLLAKWVDMPIVPVGIAGAYDFWPRWRALPIPDPVFLSDQGRSMAVSIGEPIDSRRFAGQPREQVLSDLFVELQKCKERAERLRRKTPSV
jgi:1-acyl-sn-glycerol-3-phosphate acyltransferase